MTSLFRRLWRPVPALLARLGLRAKPKRQRFTKAKCGLCGRLVAYTRHDPHPWKHDCRPPLPMEFVPPVLTVPPQPLCPGCRAPLPCGCAYVGLDEGETVTRIGGGA